MSMFGANAVRQRRERERREKVSRGGDVQAFPYIKPYGPRFDRNELPYFKHRTAFKMVHQGSEKMLEGGPWEVGLTCS